MLDKLLAMVCVVVVGDAAAGICALKLVERKKNLIHGGETVVSVERAR